ncbi:hypothetical protein HDU97_005158 [Phlyctochytrium planicorne]|nr:hypothetical protein HDU97_005158 [Phlyctochytrium planicorne]
MLKELQKDSAVTYQEGRTRARSMKMTLDALRSEIRPFFFYLITMAVDLYASAVLTSKKFKKVNSSNRKFTYWVWTPSNVPLDDEHPIIFVHGIGIGLASYLNFILHARSRFPRRRLILIELRHVSMQMEDEVATVAETFDAVEEFYGCLNIKKAIWIGHSLGTVICSWMIKMKPHMIEQVILIDPIVFLLYEPDVAYNFLYRKPGNGFQLLMWFMASQELFISHSLRRNFWWYLCILFPEDLPSDPKAPTRVFVSENDQIISCRNVYGHLKRGEVSVKEWKGFRHGQFAFKKEAQTEVLDSII